MGTVYLAEQREPIHRFVALKVVKLGMDTSQVLARFANERQALAMMDHPNIARIFDAGATEKGRPYFVMEYIEGAPITQYCDRKRMTTRERLALFLAVCRAVQHAHQKGASSRGGCTEQCCGGRRPRRDCVIPLQRTLEGYLFLCRRRDGKRRCQNHRRHRQTDIESRNGFHAGISFFG